MAGQGFSCFAFDEDADSLDGWDVDGEGFDQGVDGELFAEDAGAVLVGEGGVEIDNGDSGIDEVDAADVGGGSERVRCVRVAGRCERVRGGVLRRAAGVHWEEEFGRSVDGGFRQRHRRHRA